MSFTHASTARPAPGFTLWELLCALAVAAVVLATATPGLSAAVLNARRTAEINAFVTAVQLARSEAAKRGRTVVLCGSADLSTCGGGFAAGWIVFVDEDRIRPVQRGPSEPLLHAHRPPSTARISSNRAAFELRVFARRSTNGTVTFCDPRGAGHARAVVVSYTGRPRVTAPGAGGALSCA